jgi:hypothetical protein
MPSPTVIPATDPRAKALQGVCLALSCGFFIVELVSYLLLQPMGPEEGGVAFRVLEARAKLFGLGKNHMAVYAAAGVLIHAGIAALLSAALQRTWLRSRRLALSAVLLLFTAFQGALVALALGQP